MQTSVTHLRPQQLGRYPPTSLSGPCSLCAAAMRLVHLHQLYHEEWQIGAVCTHLYVNDRRPSECFRDAAPAGSQGHQHACHKTAMPATNRWCRCSGGKKLASKVSQQECFPCLMRALGRQWVCFSPGKHVSKAPCAPSLPAPPLFSPPSLPPPVAATSLKCESFSFAALPWPLWHFSASSPCLDG